MLSNVAVQYIDTYLVNRWSCHNRIFLDAYPTEHMQLAWNGTKQPLVVINTQMAEFEIADISYISENVTYKAGRF